jgi:hypothetical protein
MPPITYPITQAGLILPVVIGVHRQRMIHLLAAGQSLPAPVQVRGMIDSAADVTAVAANVLQQSAAQKVRAVSTRTAAGNVVVNVFVVSLSIRGPDPTSGLLWTVPTLFVTELATALPDAEVLLGLDVLLAWRMYWDGPGRLSTLDF